MPTALKEIEEPKEAPIEPFAERNGQAGPDANEEEEDNGEYFPEQPFVYELDLQGYITSDGQGMAEKPEHRREINKAEGMLLRYFNARADSYIGGCDFIHYRKGVRTKYISPDLYVIFGLEGDDIKGRNADNYKVWKNGGQMPAFIIEYTSIKTKAADYGSKFTLYEQVFKTPEYIVFDPRQSVLRLKRRLRGYRLNASGQYEPIPMEPTPLCRERLYSEQLGLYLETHGIELRFFDPKAGAYLRTFDEEAADRQREEQRANNEARERRKAEQQARKEAQRANEEIKARQDAERRANEETEARQAAEQRADEETHLRLAEAEENARLRAEIAALRNKADS